MFEENHFRKALKFFKEISDALSFLQEYNYIHCDIKPSNIMITGGRNKMAKIIDIGGLTNTHC